MDDEAVKMPDFGFDAEGRFADQLCGIVRGDSFAELLRRIDENPPARPDDVFARGIVCALVRGLRPKRLVAIGKDPLMLVHTLEHAARANGMGEYQRQDDFTRYREADPDVVLLRNQPEFPLAQFELAEAARRIAPGGFILVVMNGELVARRAVACFLDGHPEWTDVVVVERGQAHDGRLIPEMFESPNAALAILRAPRRATLAAIPLAFRWDGLRGQLVGVGLDFVPQAIPDGTLELAFRAPARSLVYAVAAESLNSSRRHELRLVRPLDIAETGQLELALVWHGRPGAPLPVLRRRPGLALAEGGWVG